MHILAKARPTKSWLGGTTLVSICSSERTLAKFVKHLNKQRIS
jgi:hypothetical protein